jgi:hypothetical protein
MCELLAVRAMFFDVVTDDFGVELLCICWLLIDNCHWLLFGV